MLLRLCEEAAEKPLVADKVRRVVRLLEQELGEEIVIEAIGHLSATDSTSKFNDACGASH